MKKLSICLMFTLCALTSVHTRADIHIIVHTSNQVDMSQAYIKRIFLGKVAHFPGGKPAIPVNIQAGTDLRKTFERIILNKSDAQVRSYWAKRIFTGKGIPPKEVNLLDLLTLIASDPRFIGYTNEAADLGPEVRVSGQY